MGQEDIVTENIIIMMRLFVHTIIKVSGHGVCNIIIINMFHSLQSRIKMLTFQFNVMFIEVSSAKITLKPVYNTISDKCIIFSTDYFMFTF